jgi:hypothetical protein
VIKVNYTLPGLMPDAAPRPPAEPGDGEPFAAHLQRLRLPDVTDWRAVLRLNAAPTGATAIAPPPAPGGLSVRDGALQRAWWRGFLLRHDSGSDAQAGRGKSLQRMIGLLAESQRREEEIFARHFAEQES